MPVNDHPRVYGRGQIMTAATSIPVTILPEAAEYIDQLGMRSEFEQMVEHTRKTVPGLRAITVEYDHDPSNTVGPGIVIIAHREPPSSPLSPLPEQVWGRWQVTTFPPEVCRQFVMMSYYDGASHGR
jgi:hypothetical protein